MIVLATGQQEVTADSTQLHQHPMCSAGERSCDELM